MDEVPNHSSLLEGDLMGLTECHSSPFLVPKRNRAAKPQGRMPARVFLEVIEGETLSVI